MDIHGHCQGFTQVRPLARHSFPNFRPKKWCSHGQPASVIFPSPLISATFQAATKDESPWKFHAPRPFFNRKRLSILANSYSRDQGSRDDSAGKVKIPKDSNLDENSAFQTATMNGDERGSNPAESAEEIGKALNGEERSSNLADSAEEIGKALNDIRMEKLGGEPSVVTALWRGVLEETAQIEWPSFQKVLGTTGVVLAVMIGSSAVLLTLNAIFAEISDKVFDGMGVQDIFGGGISKG